MDISGSTTKTQILVHQSFPLAVRSWASVPIAL